MADGDALARLYRARFSPADRVERERLWGVLCATYFQRWVPTHATTLDLACGYGEFTRNIRAARKLAVDMNPDAAASLPAGVEFHCTPADRLDALSDDTIDVCFTSNFFEHLPDKATMDRVLAEVFRVLRPGGRLIALQPNIRYLADRYWDFYDHVLPLSHVSCAEAFVYAGFTIERVHDRFLPYTTRSRLPQWPWLVRLYLALPWAWRLFGRQFLIVAVKPSPA